MSCIHPWFCLRGERRNRNTHQQVPGTYQVYCTLCRDHLTGDLPVNDIQDLRRRAYMDQTGLPLSPDTPIDMLGNEIRVGSLITFPSDRSLAIAEVLDISVDWTSKQTWHNVEFWMICRTHVNAPTMIKAQRVRAFESREYRVSTLTENASSALFLSDSWVNPSS